MWSGGYLGIAAAGTEVAELLPETWVVSMPNVAPSCCVRWVDPVNSLWETNHCIFLPRGSPSETQHPLSISVV